MTYNSHACINSLNYKASTKILTLFTSKYPAFPSALEVSERVLIEQIRISAQPSSLSRKSKILPLCNNLSMLQETVLTWAWSGGI